MVSQIDSPQVEQGFSCVPAESGLGFFCNVKVYSVVFSGRTWCPVLSRLPRKAWGLGYLDSWGKAPLPVFIERIYVKHFGRERPTDVKSIEELVRTREQKKEEKRKRKQSQDLSGPDFK